MKNRDITLLATLIFAWPASAAAQDVEPNYVPLLQVETLPAGPAHPSSHNMMFHVAGNIESERYIRVRLLTEETEDYASATMEADSRTCPAMLTALESFERVEIPSFSVPDLAPVDLDSLEPQTLLHMTTFRVTVFAGGLGTQTVVTGQAETAISAWASESHRLIGPCLSPI